MSENNSMNEVYELLKLVKVTKKNKEQVQEIRQYLIDRDFDSALELIKKILIKYQIFGIWLPLNLITFLKIIKLKK